MEQSIETHIGDEIEVRVWFDYEPPQFQTYWEPGCDSEIEINAVLVEGDKEKNIADILSPETLEHLRMRCFEYMEAEQELHE